MRKKRAQKRTQHWKSQWKCIKCCRDARVRVNLYKNPFCRTKHFEKEEEDEPATGERGWRVNIFARFRLKAARISLQMCHLRSVFSLSIFQRFLFGSRTRLPHPRDGELIRIVCHEEKPSPPAAATAEAPQWIILGSQSSISS